MRANCLCKEKTQMKNLSSALWMSHQQGTDLLSSSSVYISASVISLSLKHLLSLISEWSLYVHWIFSDSLNHCSFIQICKIIIVWDILLSNLLHKTEIIKKITDSKLSDCLMSANHCKQSIMKVCELCSLKV